MGNKNESYINIIYDAKKDYKDKIKIFGYKFVENNKNKCQMIIDNKVYEISDKYDIMYYNNNILNVKLKGINNITNMRGMFINCSSLLSLHGNSKWNTNNVTDMHGMFKGCSSLLSLPDISKWNTINVTDMGDMFRGCSSLSSLPDISKWNTNNVTDMSCSMDVNH